MKTLLRLIAPAVMTMSLLLTGSAIAMQAPAAKAQPKAAGTNVAAKPSAQEIADAKSKGLVWVNSNTHVYHKDGSNYGTTKNGKFMTEDDAKKGGNHAAKEPQTKKK